MADPCGGPDLVVDRCPLTMVEPEWFEVLALAEAAERGAWPEPGGMLEQCRWFVAAARAASMERKRWRKPDTTLNS